MSISISFRAMQLPECLRELAKPCPACRTVRDALEEFVKVFTGTGYQLWLMCDQRAVAAINLRIKCGCCGDTGWEFDDQAVKVVNALATVLEGTGRVVKALPVEGAIIEVVPDDVDQA